MKLYLYGAAVQGIQSFIFQTNRLKEIVGASELVSLICTDYFEEFVKGGNAELIQRAAGIVKCVFSNKVDCEKAVLEFPRKVMEVAPGITINQAVVSFEEGKFREAVDALEKRIRAQRNKNFRSMTMGLLGIERSRTTGMPAVIRENGDYIDLASLKKQEMSGSANYGLCCLNFGKGNFEYKQLVFNIDEMTGKNDWIAVVHIDGNGLGQIVQKIGNDKNELRKFSQKLERATILSAQDAFKATIDYKKFKEKGLPIPIRPIVLSGDDHTIICRADMAFKYVKEFLKAFEQNTKVEMKDVFSNAQLKFSYLTACAGIAYTKSSYPFHYAYQLSETLCGRAKKDAKEENHLKNDLPLSCLQFYKVQDSFIENFDEIIARELITPDKISFEYGPYYLYLKENAMKNRWCLDQLINSVDSLSKVKDNKNIKSDLRNIVSLLYTPGGSHVAKQRIKRVKDNLGSEGKKIMENIFGLDKEENISAVLPIYDILVLDTVINQQTKEVDDEKN